MFFEKQKKKINIREETMQKIRQMGLEDFVTQIAEMEPASAIKYLSEALINLFMLKERDFFLNQISQHKTKQMDFIQGILPVF